MTMDAKTPQALHSAEDRIGDRGLSCESYSSKNVTVSATLAREVR